MKEAKNTIQYSLVYKHKTTRIGIMGLQSSCTITVKSRKDVLGASGLVLNCLPMPHKKDAGLIWVNPNKSKYT